jgi:subtilisin-like proprotein convertase family protein
MALPNDPLFNLQWFLRNTGQEGGTAGIDINVVDVWTNYTGTGIRIGIYDDGVQVDHPDLVGNHRANLQPVVDGAAHAGTPVLPNDNHGTSVAGLIVAQGNNNLGVVGVAYGATFGTARYLGADGNVATQLLNQQNLYDVTNHSWGTTANWFNDQLDPGFQAGAQNGRNGLGTVSLKAAGNERTPAPDEPVGRDANDSASNASRFNIIVAAVENTGFVADYSSPSASVLISAPAGPTAPGLNQDVTTDRTGAAGYNDGSKLPAGEPDYATFNGTSAATPVTSGVVALILQANPLLGYRDVQAILAYSARQVGSAMGAQPANSEADIWEFNGARNWNGGGLHFSNDYGFGLVDARVATRLAESWLIGRTAQTFANEVSSTASVTQAAQAIPENPSNGLQYTFNLTQNLTIEQVSLSLQLNHTAVGDLRIRLTSPNGSTSDIWRGTNAATAINTTWSFGSREFMGEAAAGTWTLTITDTGALGTGTIGNATLTAYGAAFTTNTNFIYTNEIARFNTGNRLTLTDTDGGTDTLNAAGVTTGSQLNLSEGAASTIAGQTVTIANGSTIENAFGGDGADTLIGNAINNQLRGGRADDTLDGGLGADTALFAGLRAQYQITKTAGGYQVRDLTANRDGTDQLANMEIARFSDRSVDFTVAAAAAGVNAGQLKTLLELYVGFFNRIPEAAGVKYWIDQLKATNDLTGIANQFYAAGVQFSAQTGYSATMTNAEFITKVYANVLGRSGATAPNAGEIAYWNDRLVSGADTKGSMVLTMISNVHQFFTNDPTWGFVASLLTNKSTVANTYAIQQGLSYNTPEENITQGMAMAAAVTPTSTAAAIALIGVSDVFV